MVVSAQSSYEILTKKFMIQSVKEKNIIRSKNTIYKAKKKYMYNWDFIFFMSLARLFSDVNGNISTGG